VTVWFASEALATLCQRALRLRTHDDPSATRAEIVAIDAATRDWEPPARWEEGAGFASREFDTLLAADNLRGFYHHDGPSWQFYDPATATGIMSLLDPLGIPPWETGSPLRLMLHWAYAAAGRRMTHAATLGHDGRGALIVGASGSGKSGTALAGLLHGLDSAGDDYVLVEQGPRVVAHALFNVFKQDPAGLRRAGMAGGVADMPRNWHGKIEFDAARLAGKPLAAEMEIIALLLPRIAHETRTTITRVGAREAALGLAPSSVFQLPGDMGTGFGFLSDLVRRLPAYRVNLSDNPAEIADAIGSLLTQETHHASRR
jgi:hypothetical protein